eukprot:5587474-Amphidinium_carterae.1
MQHFAIFIDFGLLGCTPPYQQLLAQAVGPSVETQGVSFCARPRIPQVPKECTKLKLFRGPEGRFMVLLLVVVVALLVQRSHASECDCTCCTVSNRPPSQQVNGLTTMCSPLPANDPASCASDCQLSD